MWSNAERKSTNEVREHWVLEPYDLEYFLAGGVRPLPRTLFRVLPLESTLEDYIPSICVRQYRDTSNDDR